MSRDGFSSVGTQTGAIKLAMAGTYVGLVAPIYSIVAPNYIFMFYEIHIRT